MPRLSDILPCTRYSHLHFPGAPRLLGCLSTALLQFTSPLSADYSLSTHSLSRFHALLVTSLPIQHRISRSISTYEAKSASLRIPTKYAGGKPYDEKIWDHASGCLLIEESGGVCTDMHGRKLDFGVGRTLSGNEGIVAAGREVHSKAIEAVRWAIAK